jgi:hypothetical protein
MADEPRDVTEPDADPVTPDDIGDDPGPDLGSETGRPGVSGTGTTDFRPGYAEPTAATERIQGAGDDGEDA